jgi:hypothetical protein
VKEELVKIWQLTSVRIMPPVLFTAGIFPYTLQKFQTELFNLRPTLNILMQKAMMLGAYRTVGKLSAEQ